MFSNWSFSFWIWSLLLCQIGAARWRGALCGQELAIEVSEGAKWWFLPVARPLGDLRDYNPNHDETAYSSLFSRGLFPCLGVHHWSIQLSTVLPGWVGLPLFTCPLMLQESMPYSLACRMLFWTKVIWLAGDCRTLKMFLGPM